MTNVLLYDDTAKMVEELAEQYKITTAEVVDILVDQFPKFTIEEMVAEYAED